MKAVFGWILRVAAAGILLQTLYFKFTGAPESVYIFTTMGLEPFGRIGSGIAELIAAILLLVPRTTIWGALLASGIMAGAIASHLFVLGIEVMGDNGLLFILAGVTFICCILLIFEERDRLPLLKKHTNAHPIYRKQP